LPSLVCRALSPLPFLLLLLSAAALAEAVTPPEVLTRVDATPPVNAPPPTQDHVLLEFTIGLDGRVSDVVVIESAGAVWDEATKEALAQWTFKPAIHQGQKVASRTRLPFNLLIASPPDAGTNEPGESSPAPTDAGSGTEAITEIEPELPVGGHPPHELSTTVIGRVVPKSRGVGDFHIDVGELKVVPRKAAADFLKLAPGVLLTKEGGEGHPEQIFLRGFDAREGQDLELTADGVPINDSGNLHGNGYADLNFIIPELVESLRVVEGPFDPRQGNYAVAGSANYELGLAQRGLTVKGSYGSFDTQRLLLLFGPPGGSNRTYAGAELNRTAGYGQGREAQSAKAMAQFEALLSEETSVRVAATAYTAHFQSAGLLRVDDVVAGRKGFFDTYDDRQGGDSLRGSVSVELHHHRGPFAMGHQLFFIYRSTRLKENFTGFLQDLQTAEQQPHPQRGDLIDRDSTTTTLGLKGWGKWRAQVLDAAQELELGYFARIDVAHGTQLRVQAQSNAPYHKDLDLDSRLADIGLYADANLTPWKYLIVRGGVRADLFTYDINNNCAVQSVRRPAAERPPGDASCYDQQDFGKYREPTERNSTTGTAVMPRVSVLLGPWKGATLSAAYGYGVRSIDPQYVTESLKTPFASIQAGEAGAAWSPRTELVDLTGRAAFFLTRVDKDLLFSEQAGRSILGGSTTRLGGLVAARARGPWFDLSANGTLTQSKFDDTNTLVPYVPDLVLRLDAAIFHDAPWALMGAPLRGTLGAGITYVGRRALPLGARSDSIFTLDANLEVKWRWLTLGVAATNLLDAQYRLGEYNFASDFQTTGVLPTLVPSRLFSAGAPRSILVSLAVNLGGSP